MITGHQNYKKKEWTLVFDTLDEMAMTIELFADFCEQEYKKMEQSLRSGK